MAAETTISGSVEPRVDRSAVDVALLIVRIALGIVFIYHGGQKMFGLFGGPGLAATAKMMGTLGYFVSVGEFFGGLGILVGFLSRFSAASIAVIMLGAIITFHGKNGFSMANKGYEYNFALIGLALPILIAGPGRYAIGRFLPLPKAKGSDRPITAIE
jgi:putative oxidoreductase